MQTSLHVRQLFILSSNAGEREGTEENRVTGRKACSFCFVIFADPFMKGEDVMISRSVHLETIIRRTEDELLRSKDKYEIEKKQLTLRSLRKELSQRKLDERKRGILV